MFKKVVIGLNGFGVGSSFEDKELYLLQESGDTMDAKDMTTLENFIRGHRDGDLFFMPVTYAPTAGNKGGMMYAPFSKRGEDESVYFSEKITPEMIGGRHRFSPFGVIYRGRYLNRLMEKVGDAESFTNVLIKGTFTMVEWLFEVQAEASLHGKLYYVEEVSYTLIHSGLGDKTFFPGIYEKDWYENYLLFLENWIKGLVSGTALGANANAGNVSGLTNFDNDKKRQMLMRLAQEHALFVIKFMIEANLDNVNKHLFEGDEAEAMLLRLGRALAGVPDDVICGGKLIQDPDSTDKHARIVERFPGTYHIKKKNEDLITWLLLMLKYQNKKLEFDFEGGFYCFEGNPVGALTKPTADIQFMDNADDHGKTNLTIEGRLNPIMLMNGGMFGVMAKNHFYPAVFDQRYAHTKAFGMSVYKLHAFTIKLPVEYAEDTDIAFVVRMTDRKGCQVDLPVTLEFDSHFSRLCDKFDHSYWKINKHLYSYVSAANVMAVRPAKKWDLIKREVSLWGDMIKTKNLKVIKFIIVRAFLLAKPLLKHKPIWLFWDKIYKAGDSAEYMFKYAQAKEDGIKCYYLADENCEDYARLVNEGYKPVKRRSIMHRYAFLYADMIIVSNSTVYAFNDFGTVNSALIRDLMNFHVCCVQHGMSIQKIAVAQNRLRDNTRLYFCASKYEVENLSKPIYGYGGHDALKLTGVPRYDGLVNDDKKQILITPTWRMQAAVPVTKNEGVARDYNPLFKRTDYYRIYNSLINDHRLIGAAKRCGYKLLYVLHPIVSPQIDDFDKNDAVEIIPSVATKGHPGVNYEKVLKESSLMVTDYSGVQFDFAYMKKPVVYLHHKDIPKHYEEGSFFYDTMGFGEICTDNEELVNALIDYMEEGCKIKPEYKARVEDFFAFSDRKNCERIYRVMKDYQEKYINM